MLRITDCNSIAIDELFDSNYTFFFVYVIEHFEMDCNVCVSKLVSISTVVWFLETTAWISFPHLVFSYNLNSKTVGMLCKILIKQNVLISESFLTFNSNEWKVKTKTKYFRLYFINQIDFHKYMIRVNFLPAVLLIKAGTGTTKDWLETFHR